MHDSKVMPSERQIWIDVAKGVAIVLVVFGHALRGVEARGLIPEDIFLAVDRRLYAFHMPVFFALSGLFITSTLARMSPGRYLNSRLQRMVWPIVLWTYLFLLFKLLAGQAANTPVGIEDLLIWPFPGYLHLWFLWALFLLHAGLLLTRPLLQNGQMPWIVLISLFLVSCALVPIEKPDLIDHWAGQALRHAPYFLLGIIFGRLTIFEPRGPVFAIAAALGFVTLLTFHPMLNMRVLHLASSLALTTCFLVTVAYWGRGNGRITAGIAYLGSASMAIYLVHTIISAATREALLVLDQTSPWLHLGLGTLTGIVGPLVVLWLAQRWRLQKLLGF